MINKKNYYGQQWLSIQIKKQQKTDDIVEKSAVVIEALKKDLKSRTAEL